MKKFKENLLIVLFMVFSTIVCILPFLFIESSLYCVENFHNNINYLENTYLVMLTVSLTHTLAMFLLMCELKTNRS